MNKILRVLGTDTQECRAVAIIFAMIMLMAILMEIMK
jgi:hypothetical protein